MILHGTRYTLWKYVPNNWINKVNSSLTYYKMTLIWTKLVKDQLPCWLIWFGSVSDQLEKVQHLLWKKCVCYHINFDIQSLFICSTYPLYVSMVTHTQNISMEIIHRTSAWNHARTLSFSMRGAKSFTRRVMVEADRTVTFKRLLDQQ